MHGLGGFTGDLADAVAGVGQSSHCLVDLLHAVVNVVEHGVEGCRHAADLVTRVDVGAQIQVVVTFDGMDGVCQAVDRRDHDATQQQTDQDDAGDKQRQLNQGHADQVAVDLLVQGFKRVGHAYGADDFTLFDLVAEQAVGAAIIGQGGHGRNNGEAVPLLVIDLGNHLLTAHGALIVLIHRMGVVGAGAIDRTDLLAANNPGLNDGVVGQNLLLQGAAVGHGTAEHQHVDAVEVGTGGVQGTASDHLINQRGLAAVNGGQRADQDDQEYSDQ